MENNKKSKINSKSKSSKIHSVSVAYSKPTMTKKPKISGNPYAENGSVRIRHKEYLNDILGSKGFDNTSFPINPGLSVTFPWLSDIANRFESYKFHQLKFCYDPTCTSITPGSVLMAVDFDAADQKASSKQAIMSYHNAVRSAPWDSVEYQSSKSDLLKFGIQRYVRSDVIPNTDIKTYDVGSFQLATILASDDNIPWGELYVEYDVELFTPQVDDKLKSSSCLAQFIQGVTKDNLVTEIGEDESSSSPIVTLTVGSNIVKFNFAGQFLVTGCAFTQLTGPLNVLYQITPGQPITISQPLVSNLPDNEYGQQCIVTITEEGALCLLSCNRTDQISNFLLRITSYPQPLA
jgi:hypothetical protein